MKKISRSLYVWALVVAGFHQCVPSALGQSFLTNGLVAYYPFNGNANDASGNGNNCTVNGAQLGTDRFGNPANSYSFTGLQYIDTSSSAGFPAGTNDFSISVWVALRFLTNDVQIVFCNAAVNDLQLGVWPPTTGTTAPMDFMTGGDYGTPDVHTADVPWVPDQWYNLQIVRSQNVVTIYRNNVVIGQNSVASGVTAPPASRYLRFGRGVPPQQHQLFGQLDDIRVYNRALSPSEVQQLYTIESSDSPVDLTTGLVAYYPFNGNANDQTTNANNGSVNGAVLTPDKLNQPGRAYAFNGANAYVSAPNRSYLTFPNGEDFSVSVWAAATGDPSTSSYRQWFICGLDNGPGVIPKWMLTYGPLNSASWPQNVNAVSFATTTGGDSLWLATSVFNPSLGSWHHYVVTKAGSSYLAYIDGLPTSGTNYSLATGTPVVVTNPPSTLPTGITAPFTIGWAEGGGYFNGKLDDVRIYSRALSASEVQQLYLIEAGPKVDLIKAIKPSFYNLTLTTNYQMQISSDLTTWVNYGSPFTATNTTMVYPQYWDVENWNSLFFRLQIVP